MATKKQAGKKARTRPRKPPFDSDSPITVGGGGGIGPFVESGFDHNDYVPDPEDRDNFIDDDVVLASLEVNDTATGHITRDSEIVVNFKKGGSSGKIIVTGVPLGVRFNGKKLRYNHQQKKHRADGWELKTLEIDSDPPINLSDTDTIEIHTAAR